MSSHLSAVPCPAYFVRRRKSHGSFWLIARNTRYQLDPITDAVWVACDGETTTAEIIRKLAESHQLDPEQARSAAVRALEFFRRLRLISFEQSS